MRLKRLEVYGYKSFASRSTFEFSEGITAIVGPNGSGKSNLADAVRWVMGEQSYRALRAKSTRDMIFAGSRNRARLGMAEAILTLDNAEGWLPIDYSEVTVTRRAFRSGENEYLLNGNKVRFRDVLDLLGGAGLARSTYTVIGQGLVDAALSLRPEARRALFEEAAGIAPHLRKRADALNRIAETERNLERVNDILAEIRPRSHSLRRQAERAEEHLLLSQDLSELQRIWYGYQWQRCQSRLGRAEAQMHTQTALVESLHAYADQFGLKREALETNRQEKQARLTQLRSQIASLERQVESIERQQAVAAERRRLYQKQIEGLDSEIAAQSSRLEILEREIQGTEAELATHNDTLTAAQAELIAARERLQASDTARRALEARAAIERTDQTKLTHRVSQLSAQVEQARAREHELAAETAENRTRREGIAVRVAEVAGQVERLREREQRCIAARDELLERIAQLEGELAEARTEETAQREAVNVARAQRDQLTARYQALTRLRQELTGYHPGVREALSPRAGLKGLLGTVVSLMTVPERIEEAIESALGARLQNIVAERWDDAEAAIAHLRRTRAGWATFLPLDTIRSQQPISLRGEWGVVGVASDLVEHEPRLRPVFQLLLGRIVVVEDLDTSRRLLNHRMGASLFVTLAGETVQPSGVLSGGTRRNKGNLMAQEREWRALPPRIKRAAAALREASESLEASRAAIAEISARIEGAHRDSAQVRREMRAAQDALAEQTKRLRDAEAEGEWIERRLGQIDQETSRLTANATTLSEALETAEKEQIVGLASLRQIEEELAGTIDKALRRQVAELDTHRAVAERTVQSHRRLLASHRDNREQLRVQIEEKRSQREGLARDLEQLAAAAADRRQKLTDLGAEIAERVENTEPAEQALANLAREQRELEQQRGEAAERLSEAELALSRMGIERDGLRDQQSALAREIESALGPIDLPDSVSHQLRLSLDDNVIELPYVANLPQGLGDDIRQLRARVRRLGNVNPDAPKEYEQLLERQTFMQRQEQDLRGAIASLYEIIQELDAVIETDFSTTFQVVNASFGHYFETLFGGGSARLLLTDPGDVGNTGVEIMAHPPGKRSQRLSLLSGGERALTAVALLFALLDANPVPFCFLDEVDAALDEANVRRFRALLQEHALTTQFVVITHNRRTIEAADTIYGVSMSEQGVSQCISLKLDTQGEPVLGDDGEQA